MIYIYNDIPCIFAFVSTHFVLPVRLPRFEFMAKECGGKSAYMCSTCWSMVIKIYHGAWCSHEKVSFQGGKHPFLLKSWTASIARNQSTSPSMPRNSKLDAHPWQASWPKLVSRDQRIPLPMPDPPMWQLPCNNNYHLPMKDKAFSGLKFQPISTLTCVNFISEMHCETLTFHLDVRPVVLSSVDLPPKT